MAALLMLTTAGRVDPAGSPLLESLREQDRGDWKLVVLATDQRFGDSRIVTAASLSELWDAGHEFVSLLDPGTRLESSAVGHIVAAMRARPDADAVYGDETRVDDTTAPFGLRTAWSVESIRSTYYVGDPFVVRTSALKGVAAPGDTSRASRHRLALHLAESGATVLHLPVPLAASDPQPEEGDSIVVHMNEHLRRCAVPATAIAGHRPGTIRLDPAFVDRPSLSVVVPTAGVRSNEEPTGERLVRCCLRSLELVDWPEMEIVIVVGDEFDGDPAELASEGRHDVRVVRRGPGAFSFAAAANSGVLAAAGELVLLLNDDTEAHDGDWLPRLAMHAVDPGVGAVGATLVFADGTIQHVGMVIDDARPLHPFVGQPLDAPDLIVGHPRTVAAVTGACLMVERRKYLEVGGMSSRFPLSFNDVDLCFKLARTGYRTVHEPGAVLTHHEGATRGASIEKWEWDQYIDRWGSVADPWYHPGYERPGDPHDPRRDADHILPSTTMLDATPRDARLRPTVHHSRNQMSDESDESGGTDESDRTDESGALRPPGKVGGVDEQLSASVEVPATTVGDVVDSDDPRELRVEILNLRDEVIGASARGEVLEDRVRELELQVEDLAVELEKYSSLTSNPVVRALLATSRPFRRFFERRRAGP